MYLERCEQMGHGESQGIRDADEAQHGEVASALLNLDDIRETSGRNTARVTVGREFPSCTLSVCAAGS